MVSRAGRYSYVPDFSLILVAVREIHQDYVGVYPFPLTFSSDQLQYVAMSSYQIPKVMPYINFVIWTL